MGTDVSAAKDDSTERATEVTAHFKVFIIFLSKIDQGQVG
jgi:hypothetical protein